MLQLHIPDESSRLRLVVLGTAKSNGPAPDAATAYDPKSLEHIRKGTYPKEEDMVAEMTGFSSVLEKYGVTVVRPQQIAQCNQIFARDIGFVIEQTFIKANVLSAREDEWQALSDVVAQTNPEQLIRPPAEVRIEGGDVIVWNDYIFIGTYRGADFSEQITARTNAQGVDFIQQCFPHKKVRAFDLIKSATDPRDNALHLDCCFQPVGTDKAIIYEGGFRDRADCDYLLRLFGKERVFCITREEMYQMYANVFSIAPDIVVSERHFTRLNRWLEAQGIQVVAIPYAEIAKQGGLLRCSTLPLIRD